MFFRLETVPIADPHQCIQRFVYRSFDSYTVSIYYTPGFDPCNGAIARLSGRMKRRVIQWINGPAPLGACPENLGCRLWRPMPAHSNALHVANIPV